MGDGGEAGGDRAVTQGSSLGKTLLSFSIIWTFAK